MQFGRSHKNRIKPELSLQEVWETFSGELSDRSDKNHRKVFRNFQYFDPDTREGILNDLLRIETESLRQNDRLRHVRQKIMDLVDRRAAAQNLRQVTNLTEKADDEADRRLELAIADCDIQISILRAYTRDKYGDQSPGDWFRIYSHLSEFFNLKMAADSAVGSRDQFIFEGEWLDPTKENFQDCREKCLDAYVGQYFEIPMAVRTGC